MRCCLASLVVFMAGLLHNCTPIDPACDCVVYQSHGGNQGRFNSPDFPTPYPANKNCILYTFIGEPEEIIKLEFIEFNFKMPDPSGRCVDFLRVYNTIDRPEVNEYNKHDLEFCGGYSSIQNTVYSSSRSLVLEFHSDYRRGKPGNYTGFKGVYQFVDRRKYITTGDRMDGGCSYNFSSNATNKKGRFFSPFYPQNYKPNSSCRYHFNAMHGERVRVVFKNVQLHDTASSCRDSPDVIKVYDGKDTLANVIGHLCGIHNDEEVISTGTDLYVAFTCDDKNQKQGFAATYEFTSNKGSSTINDSGTSIIANPNPPHCNQYIKSTEHRNGSISSPNYPFAYPADITCRYVFTGVGRERIQLRFLHMDLHFPRGDPTEPVDCAGSDSVTVYVIINGTTEVIDTWCGKELPHMLMSSQHKMIVEFRSYHSSVEVTGFMAHYSFVTNFGIKEGQQDNRGMCVFNYQSSVRSQGNITSPNYEGLYPRNTECHYLFYGKENERVRIEFTDFDIEGYMPRCDEQSDYVSFSNFANSEDRKMTRLCGGPPHKKVEWSDGPFFRVIFKSNECYDSTGFKAKYQFVASDKEKKGKDIRTSEEETYSVQGRRNSGSSGSRPHKDKRSDRGGGLLPLAPFISLTFICPTLISLRFIPVTLF